MGESLHQTQICVLLEMMLASHARCCLNVNKLRSITWSQIQYPAEFVCVCQCIGFMSDRMEYLSQYWTLYVLVFLQFIHQNSGRFHWYTENSRNLSCSGKSDKIRLHKEVQINWKEKWQVSLLSVWYYSIWSIVECSIQS